MIHQVQVTFQFGAAGLGPMKTIGLSLPEGQEAFAQITKDGESWVSRSMVDYKTLGIVPAAKDAGMYLVDARGWADGRVQIVDALGRPDKTRTVTYPWW